MSGPELVYNALDVLSPRQMFRRFQHRLPTIVVVSRGFYGSREEISFSCGQVLRLHAICRQERALVHDKKNQTLSVPLDYPLLFCVGDNHQEALTLRQILQRHDPPVKVEVADKRVRFESVLGSHDHLSVLTVMEQYQEVYFTSNTVSQGDILSTVLPIPMYLSEVKFSPLLGLKGRGITDGGQRAMAAMLHPPSLLHVDFSRDHSDKEIVQLSEKPLTVSDNMYETVDTIYINVDTLRQRLSLLPAQEEPRHIVTTTTAHNATAHNYASNGNTGRPVYASLGRHVAPPERPPKPASLSRQADPCLDYYTYTNNGEYEHMYVTGDRQKYAGELATPFNNQQQQQQQRAPHAAVKRDPTDPPPYGVPSLTSELQLALKKRKERRDNRGHRSDHSDLNVHKPPATIPTARCSPCTQQPSQNNNNKITDPSKNADGRRLNLTPPDSELPPVLKSQGRNDAPPTKATPKPKPAVEKLAKPVPTEVTKTQLADPATSSKACCGLANRACSDTGSPTTPGEGSRRVLPARSLSSLYEQQLPPTTRPASTTADKVHSYSSASNPSSQRSTPHEVHSGSVSDARTKENPYVNQTEMAVIVPTRALGSNPSSKPVAAASKRHTSTATATGVSISPPHLRETSSPTQLVGINPHQDKTHAESSQSQWRGVDVETLTIAEVQEVLAQLNLARHQNHFHKELVDGLLLSQLEDDILAEVGMTRIEIKRLRNFIQTGHLPK